MGMNVAAMSGGQDPEALLEVNTTPLIDVMLVLLVMLIITIPTQLHSIHLDIGRGEVPPQQPVVHTVSIDFDGTVAWDGQVLRDAAAVDARMQELGSVDPADQAELHVQPNKLVDYSAVATLMASAQRHHVAKMAIAGQEQFVR
ncbi:ExbD/TolR family protein [Burkholderiaceae bacterium UC74_6]